MRRSLVAGQLGNWSTGQLARVGIYLPISFWPVCQLTN
jgi:hypothetical protein